MTFLERHQQAVAFVAILTALIVIWMAVGLFIAWSLGLSVWPLLAVFGVLVLAPAFVLAAFMAGGRS